MKPKMPGAAVRMRNSKETDAHRHQVLPGAQAALGGAARWGW